MTLEVSIMIVVAKANGREPKTSLGRVFNYKLGCYDDVQVLMYAEAHPYL